MAEKKFTFTAQDNGVSSMMEKMRNKSQQLSRELMRDARQYSESGREQVQYIEEQIRAIERRNRLEKEAQKLSAEKKFQRRTQSEGASQQDISSAKQDYQQEIQNIQVSSKEDEMQTQLLRELVETTKDTAREEIRADKKDTQKQVSAYQRMSRRGKLDKMDEEESFKRAYQQEEMGRVRTQERDERRAFRRAGAIAGQGSNVAAGIATSGSEMALTAGALATIPYVGMGLSRMANTYLQKGEKYDEAMLGSRAMMGRTPFNQKELIQMTQLGYGGADTYNFSQQLAEARGGARQGMQGDRLENATTNLAAIGRGFNLDRQTLIGRAEFQRYDRNEAGTSEDILRTIEALEGGGAFQDGDFSRLEKFLQTQNQFIQQQLQFQETVNQDRTATIMQDFLKIGGGFGDTDRMLNRMQGMDQAFRNPQNDYARAFQLSSLRQNNPNASYFDLMKEKDKGILSEGYLNTSMQRIMDMPISADDRKEQMFQLFEGKISREAISNEEGTGLFNKFQENPELFSNIGQRAQELKGEGKTTKEALKRALDFTPAISSKQKRAELSTEQAGKQFIKTIDEIFGDTNLIAYVNDKVKMGLKGFESIKKAGDAAESAWNWVYNTAASPFFTMEEWGYQPSESDK